RSAPISGLAIPSMPYGAAIRRPMRDERLTQFLDELSEQFRLGCLHDVVNAGLWHAELLHGGDGVLPQPLFLLPFSEIEFGDEVRQPLPLQRALVIVISFDDLLLVGRVILFRHSTLLFALL